MLPPLPLSPPCCGWGPALWVTGEGRGSQGERERERERVRVGAEAGRGISCEQKGPRPTARSQGSKVSVSAELRGALICSVAVIGSAVSSHPLSGSSFVGHTSPGQPGRRSLDGMSRRPSWGRGFRWVGWWAICCLLCWVQAGHVFRCVCLDPGKFLPMAEEPGSPFPHSSSCRTGLGPSRLLLSGALGGGK